MIELSNVSKIYGKDEAQVEALKNVSIQIKSGEFVCIIGPSGSGKSTLLNIMGVIDKPTSGDYYIDNINVSNFSDRKMAILRNEKFGFILQYFGLIEDYTVYENVLLPIKYSRRKRKNKKEDIINLLSMLSIDNKKDFYPSELSGGQCQRVAIARALINEPEIIFADEPTGALDKETGEQIIDILKELNKKGKTIVIVSHDENIYTKCDRIIKIQDGKVKS